MSEIRCLFPSNVGHMYIAKRADLPHYQEVFSKFLTALDCYEDHMPVYLYMKGEDYSNHFLLVQNSLSAVKPYMDRLHWFAIHRSTCNPSKKAGLTSPIGKKRQDNFVEDGLCSSVSQTRDGSSDGVAEPRMKPGTIEDKASVQACLSQIDSYATSQGPQQPVERGYASLSQVSNVSLSQQHQPLLQMSQEHYLPQQNTQGTEPSTSMGFGGGLLST
jgi:hypothetical protein